MNCLTEAFRQLDCLNEDTFDITPDGIEELKDFKDNDEEEDVVEVADLDAENEEDLADSYIGKVICRCGVCKSMIYKDKEEVTLDDEEDGLVNVGEECPYCFSSSGFEVVGEVAPFAGLDVEAKDEDGNDIDVDVKVDGKKVDINKKDDEDNEEELVEESYDEDDDEDEENEDFEYTPKDGVLTDGVHLRKADESFESRVANRIIEGIDSIKLVTPAGNGQEIEVTAKDAEGGETEDGMIVPPSDDTVFDIEASAEPEEGDEEDFSEEGFDEEGSEEDTEEAEAEEEEEPNEEDAEEELMTDSYHQSRRGSKIYENTSCMPKDGSAVEAAVDEINEEYFDRLGTKFLRRVYENVSSFRTTRASSNGDTLTLEGVINFKSGNKKNTKFVFEAATINRNGVIKFIGENKDISRGRKSFTVSGQLRNNTFMPESFNYNYRAKLEEGSQKVYGTVKLNEETSHKHI